MDESPEATNAPFQVRAEAEVAAAGGAAQQRRLELPGRVPGEGHEVQPHLARRLAQEHRPRFAKALGF